MAEACGSRHLKRVLEAAFKQMSKIAPYQTYDAAKAIYQKLKIVEPPPPNILAAFQARVIDQSTPAVVPGTSSLPTAKQVEFSTS